MFKNALIIIITLLFMLSGAGTALAKAQIIINKTTNQLKYLQDGEVVRTFPVATGRHPSFTPEGSFSVVVKLVNPYYSRLGIPGGSPRNPLGVRWLGLSIGGGGVYGIHGTNNPASIGTYASAGCIRMHNRDVIWLYNHTPLGTPVTITGKPAPAPQVKPRPVTVAAGGKQITLPALPGSGDSPPLLPLRSVFELLGYSVTWDGATPTVHASSGGKTVVLNCATGQVEAGTETFRETGLKIAGGSTYGPLSLWEKVLPGTEVEWEPGTDRVTLTSQ